MIKLISDWLITELMYRNFPILPFKSLFANTWIREVAVKIWQMHWKHKKTCPANRIDEMLYSKHSNLTKYYENITSGIISAFRELLCNDWLIFILNSN